VPATMPQRHGGFPRSLLQHGDIELVMRATVDGVFVDAPRTPADVWRTAAHELAHLKHMNHGPQFTSSSLSSCARSTTLQEDHREKRIRKLVKMQQSRDERSGSWAILKLLKRSLPRSIACSSKTS
jgi:hypothetical protein